MKTNQSRIFVRDFEQITEQFKRVKCKDMIARIIQSSIR
jgi:hypothetical protein